MRLRLFVPGVFATACLLLPGVAEAFCGFYVAPSDQPLANDASMVSLMREGTRTVMSMSNNYKGPTENFAMVVPVPVVLKKEDVKTLPLDMFDKLEKLSAPRLVEYWEQDPCGKGAGEGVLRMGAGGGAPPAAAAKARMEGYGVKIEAQFKVGEYDIVILSAKESDGLERWLVDNKYHIPKGASVALAPYIKEGSKFFVAKVDIKKVAMHDGAAVLSPLRFAYESTDFRLPVRLGLLNAKAKQDLIVYVLSKDKRYEVANYANAFIPTNLEVTDATRTSFAPFYATLFDAAIAKAGGRAVVTEYAWTSSGCDPCPTPPLQPSDIATLGGDVLFGMGPPPEPPGPRPMKGVPKRPPLRGGGGGGGGGGGFFGGMSQPMVLTRMHTRYDASTLSDDLVFRGADPVVGGREFVRAEDGTLEKGAQKDSYNNFQARYAIRHEWTGKIECDHPRRGVWGGPPSGVNAPEGTAPKPATGLASAPRAAGVRLATYVKSGLDDFASWERAAGNMVETPRPIATSKMSAPAPTEPTAKKGCGCSVPGRNESGNEPGTRGVAAVCGLAFALIGLTRRATARLRRGAAR